MPAAWIVLGGLLLVRCCCGPPIPIMIPVRMMPKVPVRKDREERTHSTNPHATRHDEWPPCAVRVQQKPTEMERDRPLRNTGHENEGRGASKSKSLLKSKESAVK